MNNKIEFTRALLDWYTSNGRIFPWRKNHLSLYRVLVTETLLWKTRAETVSEFYWKFFHIYPNRDALLKSSMENLVKVIEPLGLQNRRARMLKCIAVNLYKQKGLDEGSLKAIFCVGQYIARATLAIYYEKQVIPIDSNIKRLLERVFDFYIRNIRKISKMEEAFLDKLTTEDHKQLVWAMIDYSSVICTRENPKCNGCVLKKCCSNYAKAINAT